jgi:hypothetical protein
VQPGDHRDQARQAGEDRAEQRRRDRQAQGKSRDQRAQSPRAGAAEPAPVLEERSRQRDREDGGDCGDGEELDQPGAERKRSVDAAQYR